MKYPKVRNGIIITGKVDTTAIEILATKPGTIKMMDNKSGNKWECKDNGSMITLLHELPHFILAKFGESFF